MMFRKDTFVHPIIHTDENRGAGRVGTDTEAKIADKVHGKNIFSNQPFLADASAK
jgi:hypothetical protein